VVLPTETVYGIACRPDDAGATARLFEAKRRPRGLNLPVLAATAGAALALADVPEQAPALAAAFWPGPLTIVLRRSASSSSWDLGDEHGTIGVRVPDLLLTRAVLEAAGPLGVTSANLSGEPAASDRDALLATFGDGVERGRVPFISRLRRADGSRVWARILTPVLRHPVAATLASAGVLAALAIPTLSLHTAASGPRSLP